MCAGLGMLHVTQLSNSLFLTSKSYVTASVSLSVCMCICLCVYVRQEGKDECWAEVILYTVFLFIANHSLSHSTEKRRVGHRREGIKLLSNLFPLLSSISFCSSFFLPRLYNRAVGGWVNSSHCCAVCYLFFYLITSQCAFGVAAPGWLKWTRVCQ